MGILADGEQRKRLDELREGEADADEIFQKTRNLSRQFRDGLLEFFFDKQSGMDELTRNYGVF